MTAAAVFCSSLLLGQVAGGQVFGGQVTYGPVGAQDASRLDIPVPEKMQDSGSSYLQATVLMNVPADAFVATFAAFSGDGDADEARKALDATVAKAASELAKAGIPAASVSSDFISYSRRYSYSLVEYQGNPSANYRVEQEDGFQFKKNISIKYSSVKSLDRIIAACAKAEVFDLVKVDYVVTDLQKVKARLSSEAAKVLKRKAAQFAELSGKPLVIQQLIGEKDFVSYPTDTYRAYQAQEADSTYDGLRTVRTVKPRTFYYNPIPGGSFDAVVGPVVLEPVVQFAYSIKVRASSSSQAKPKAARPVRHNRASS